MCWQLHIERSKIFGLKLHPITGFKDGFSIEEIFNNFEGNWENSFENLREIKIVPLRTRYSIGGDLEILSYYYILK
jgi:hypothetical protein